MSQGINTIASFPKGLKPGLDKITGTKYKAIVALSDSWYYQKKGTYWYEEAMALATMPLAMQRNEGEQIAIANDEQFGVSRVYQKLFGLQYGMTDQIKEYMQYDEIVQKGVRFANAFKRVEDIEGHYLFDNAYNSNSFNPIGNANFASTSHVVTGSTQSNVLAVAAPLSDASLKDLMIQMKLCVDNSNQLMEINAKKLVTHTNNMFNSRIITRSELKSGTAENDMNIFRSAEFGIEVEESQRLQDVDNWFILAKGDGVDDGAGLVKYNKVGLKQENWRAYDRGADMTTGTVEFVHWFHDYRSAYFSGALNV